MWAPVIAGLILVYPVWRILERAGFSPWFALLVFIPLLGPLAVFLMLAFMDWPRAGGGPPVQPGA